ncbi:hypothetical protein [Leptospira kmetyi]|uniref:hypothetical protein n=1 Tax=Leptospira kmetyi TaxID=408139 RepID=UPI00028875B9|nr:hypothetical protein [Leptospira kmetyi]EQA54180.1 hypothetical protein LEP1GSC052_3227 [Leptospira kmetyi serovar Malaysia str. Bejo-Iso9]
MNRFSDPENDQKEISVLENELGGLGGSGEMLVEAAQKADAQSIRSAFATVLLILFTKIAYKLYKV